MEHQQRRQEVKEDFATYAANRDQDVRRRLIEAHLGLAEHLARRFLHRGEAHDDLVQVSSLALVKALDRFDPERGVEFTTFATRTIIGELKRHFRDRGWAVRAPRRIQELYLHIGQVVATLSQEKGRSPSIKEIAIATGATEDDVIEALEAGQGYRSASLDAPGQDGESLGSRLGGDDAAFSDAEHRVELSPHLAKLPERERQILILRFVEGLTQSEIADRVGISQMHVSRLLSRSLTELRSAYKRPPD